jgi:hypothetical protein
MSDLEFDATAIPPQAPFEVIPPGKYVCQIVASERRPTKSGDGAYLWLEEEILEGEYAGRRVFDRLNIQNQNVQTVEIANRTLSALCHAVGELKVKNSEQLHFKPFVATVRVRPPSDGYDASNEVRGYAPVGGSAPASGGATRTQAAPVAKPAVVAGTAVKTPPWRTHKG